MGQSKHDATSNYTPAILAVLGCILTLSLVSAPATHALSLDPALNTITAVAQTLTSTDKEVKSSRSSSTSSSSGQRAGSAAKTATSPVTPSTNETAAAPPEEVIVTEPLQQLPTIEAPIVASPVAPAHSAGAVAVSAEALGAQSSTTPLQATEQGWKVFGIVWYWPVIVGMSFWGGCTFIYRYYINLSRYRLIPLFLRAGNAFGDL